MSTPDFSKMTATELALFAIANTPTGPSLCETADKVRQELERNEVTDQ